jgi:hypothetical protein
VCVVLAFDHWRASFVDVVQERCPFENVLLLLRVRIEPTIARQTPKHNQSVLAHEALVLLREPCPLRYHRADLFVDKAHECLTYCVSKKLVVAIT